MSNLHKFSLPVYYDLDPVFDDERFLKMRARVQHDGINPNYSNFDLADIERARNTIVNIPVLANVIFNEETGEPEFGSHDMSLEIDKMNNTDMKLIYNEVPIGLVPETPNYEIKRIDGKHYVYVDFYIWRGYSNYAEQLIERDRNVKISMEISIHKSDFNRYNSTHKIIDYKYTGITLLNQNMRTGMKNAMATIDPSNKFSFDANTKNKEKLRFMAKELNNALKENKNKENFLDLGVDLDLGLEGVISLMDKDKSDIIKSLGIKEEELKEMIPGAEQMTAEQLKQTLHKMMKDSHMSMYARRGGSSRMMNDGMMNDGSMGSMMNDGSMGNMMGSDYRRYHEDKDMKDSHEKLQKDMEEVKKALQKAGLGNFALGEFHHISLDDILDMLPEILPDIMEMMDEHEEYRRGVPGSGRGRGRGRYARGGRGRGRGRYARGGRSSYAGGYTRGGGNYDGGYYEGDEEDSLDGATALLRINGRRRGW